MSDEATAVETDVDEAAVDAAVEAETLEDGRTRCAWVRGRPEHYFFHDAEWGRLPDGDEACFERVLLACFERDVPLGEVLDCRQAIYESLGEWDAAVLSGLSDGDLDGLAEGDGLLGDRARLGWLRDVAGSVVEIAKEFKGLRSYLLVMPSMDAEGQIADVVSRFAGFTKTDAATLLQAAGCIGGSIEQWSHERDCWIY